MVKTNETDSAGDYLDTRELWWATAIRDLKNGGRNLDSPRPQLPETWHLAEEPPL